MQYSVLYEFSVFSFFTRNLIFGILVIIGILANKFSNPTDEDSEYKGAEKLILKYIISILFIVVGTFFFCFENTGCRGYYHLTDFNR